MAIGVRNANLATVGTPRHVAYKAHVPVVDHLFVPFPLKPKTVKEEGKKGTPRSSRKVAVLPPHMHTHMQTLAHYGTGERIVDRTVQHNHAP
jgi:hypothetical protein